MVVRSANVTDIKAMVSLSYEKRRFYETAQPQFWKYAGSGAETAQALWFEKLLGHDNFIIFIAEEKKVCLGFIIGKLMPAPEVYNPGGLTVMVDDFCVKDADRWPDTGLELIAHVKAYAKTKRASQIVIVCGAHDTAKRTFLKTVNLSCASEWYVGKI